MRRFLRVWTENAHSAYADVTASKPRDSDMST